jgi:hypothetical protein
MISIAYPLLPCQGEGGMFTVLVRELFKNTKGSREIL